MQIYQNICSFKIFPKHERNNYSFEKIIITEHVLKQLIN